MVLNSKELSFVVKCIEKGNTIGEIINVFNKKYGRIIGNRTIRRVAHKFKVKFANTTYPMSIEQGKFLQSLIIGKKTKTECQQAMFKKFKRTITQTAIRDFAKRHGLTMQGTYISPFQYSDTETSILNGLYLVGANEKRLMVELPTRSLKSIMKRIKLARRKAAITSDSVKETVKKELIDGKSTKAIAKKYKIDEKYVKEFKGGIKESSVEIENLKRWEEADVEDVLDGMEKQQEKLKKLDGEQGVANITIKTNNKYVALMFLSDIHLENVNTDIKQLRKDIDIIKNTKDFYVGFGGDIIDNFYVSNHSDGLLEALIPPKTARIVAGKLLDQLRGRMLWTILGCHDNWDLSTADYCLPEHIARKLKIPYLGHGGDINLKINKVEYMIHSRHKYRGTGGDNGTACCKNILRNIDAKFDLISIGHNHVAEIKIEHFLGKPRIFVRNGSYKTEDRYSKSLGYVNNSFNIQIPVAILNTETKEMKIVSGVKSASDMLTALNRIARK